MKSTDKSFSLPTDLEGLLRNAPLQTGLKREGDLISDIGQRIQSIGSSILETATHSKPQILAAAHLFRDWMVYGNIVRVIGAGRAKLAGSIPANRLAHGGA